MHILCFAHGHTNIRATRSVQHVRKLRPIRKREVGVGLVSKRHELTPHPAGLGGLHRLQRSVRQVNGRAHAQCGPGGH